MKTTINALIAGLAVACVVLGTMATANTVRTARYGLHYGFWFLPNRAYVAAWSPTDEKLIRDLRDYARTIAPRLPDGAITGNAKGYNKAKQAEEATR